jgi:hypothetical protein
MDKQLPKRFASPKPKYRITNWRDYNAALVKRGSLTLWIDEAVIDRWHQVSGKGAIYHDDAILCALCLRSVFGLALRQTQGFLHSLAAMLELGVEVPHYSTLSRRASGLKAPAQCPNRHNQSGPLHLVIDSTGLKVFGEGEWKVRTHGVGKRRVWRKLHLGVDEASGEILAHELTMNNVHDGPVLPGLLDQIDEPLDQVSADTAYDSFRCHRAIHERNARPVIPPRRGASIHPPPGMKDPPPTRGRIVQRIHLIGRKEWKKEAGYHRRSLAETAMFRFKTIIGPKLHNRKFENQKTEAAIGVAILNAFTALGRPQTIRIG